MGADASGGRAAPQPRPGSPPPGLSGSRRLPPEGLGPDTATSASPSCPFSSRRRRCRAPPTRLGRDGEGRRGGRRGGREAGGLAGHYGAAARGMRRAARAAAGRSPRPPGTRGPPPCLPSAAWARPLGSGLSGHRDQPGCALGPGSPAGSRPCAPPPPPPPCPRPRPEPPACGAEQTRLSGRPGREGGQRKEIASPRQGILNYRLKANKTYTTFSLCQPTAATKGNAKR